MLLSNKRDQFILFLCAMLFLTSACQDREAKIAETIDLSQSYLESGDSYRAVEVLKDLSDDYPNDLLVLEALAFALAQAEDHIPAAHRFEQIARTNAKQSHYLLYAANSLQAGNALEPERVPKQRGTLTQHSPPLSNIPGADFFIAGGLSAQTSCEQAIPTPF